MAKIGRPKKPRSQRLVSTLSFRVSDAQKRAIKAAADRDDGKKPAEWAKEKTLAATGRGEEG
jgi:hypothetical protein